MQHKSYHHKLHYKKYENNLIQLFTESSQEYTKWDIYNICRSIIFDGNTGKIVTMSHPNIEYVTMNSNIEEYFKMNPDLKFSESHEGTLISVFYFNDKWYYSTRRELDMYKTQKIIYGKKSELSHGQMFEDCLRDVGITKSDFENKLNKNYQYYFELVHYDNQINISYDIRFGEKYTKLFVLFMRDTNNELVPKDIILDFCNLTGIKINQELTLEEINAVISSKELQEIEGYIFMRDGHLCKLMHSNYYEKIKYNPGCKTKHEQYIYLYQNNLLEEYVKKMNCVVYDTNIVYGQVETIGLLNAVFTYIGQRMLDIYYYFNNNNMVHKNEDIFKRVFMDSKEYNIIFYTLGKMKGIHKNRQLTINEMRKFLKYNMNASDVYKLGMNIKLFEENEKLLKESNLKLVNIFL